MLPLEVLLELREGVGAVGTHAARIDGLASMSARLEDVFTQVICIVTSAHKNNTKAAQ